MNYKYVFQICHAHITSFRFLKRTWKAKHPESPAPQTRLQLAFHPRELLRHNSLKKSGWKIQIHSVYGMLYLHEWLPSIANSKVYIPAPLSDIECHRMFGIHPGSSRRFEPKVMEVDGSNEFPFHLGDLYFNMSIFRVVNDLELMGKQQQNKIQGCGFCQEIFCDEQNITTRKVDFFAKNLRDEFLERMFLNSIPTSSKTMTSCWLQPNWQIWPSNWIISPAIQAKMQKLFEATT